MQKCMDAEMQTKEAMRKEQEEQEAQKAQKAQKAQEMCEVSKEFLNNCLGNN